MQKLMQAGVKVFSEVGFNGATTRMLSQRSGINESLINRYFNGKSGLFLAIILDFIRKSKENELSYTRGETPEQEIENCLKYHFDQSVKSRDFMRIILSRIASLTLMYASRSINALLRCSRKNARVIASRLRDFQKRGEIRKDVDIETVFARDSSSGDGQ